MEKKDNERKIRSSRSRKGNLSRGADSDFVMTSKVFTPAPNVVAAASRPVTQQGMAGVRTAQTPAGLNRQYHDKRYYMAAIQSHMSQIQAETNRLKKELVKNKKMSANYDDYKQQLEAHKKELADYEETLAMYNTAIELNMSKGSKSDIDAETQKLRKSNAEKIALLEKLFADKTSREEQLAKLNSQIEEETKLFNEALASLPEEQQRQYHELWQQNEELKNEGERITNEIKALRLNINLHEQHVVQNEAKRTRYNLLVKQHELKTRRDKINEENKVKRTPSAERVHLLEQIKKDRQDTESFKAQEQEYNAELETLRDRLAELEEELSEKNSARLNKYRELLQKQETMETFLSTFDESKKELVDKLKELQSSIVFALEFIAGQSSDVNLDEIIGTRSYDLSPNLSVEELKQEYKKLSTQLKLLKSSKERITQEIEEMKKQQDIWEEEMKTYVDIDRARDDLLDQQQNLQSQKESLEKILNVTLSAVSEAEKRLKEIDNDLKFNKTYQEVIELEKKLKKRKEENEKIKAEIDSLKSIPSYEEYRTEALNTTSSILTNIKDKLGKHK